MDDLSKGWPAVSRAWARPGLECPAGRGHSSTWGWSRDPCLLRHLFLPVVRGSWYGELQGGRYLGLVQCQCGLLQSGVDSPWNPAPSALGQAAQLPVCFSWVISFGGGWVASPQFPPNIWLPSVTLPGKGLPSLLSVPSDPKIFGLCWTVPSESWNMTATGDCLSWTMTYPSPGLERWGGWGSEELSCPTRTRVQLSITDTSWPCEALSHILFPLVHHQQHEAPAVWLITLPAWPCAHLHPGPPAHGQASVSSWWPPPPGHDRYSLSQSCGPQGAQPLRERVWCALSGDRYV